MATRRLSIMSWLVTTVVGLGAAAYAWYAYDLSNRSVVDKLVCINNDPAPLAWTCDQLLRRHRFSVEEVAELNKVGGAAFPLSLKDRGKAEEFLTLFIAQGVDVNAPASQAGTTPLHMLINEPDNVRILLRHGARPGLRDAAGETALDRARRVANGRPGDGLQETIKLLTEAGAAASEASS